MATQTSLIETKVESRRPLKKAERDPQSLFDLDERLAELMDRVEEASGQNQDPPPELIQEIHEYLEAFQSKVDRIAGYWRWQESIAEICGREADRFAARKKSAEGRLARLKNMLQGFLMSRGLKKIEGERAAITVRENSVASLVIDDPPAIAEHHWESPVHLTKTELQEIVYQLVDGDLRRKLETWLAGDGWKINESAVRATLAKGSGMPGVRLVKGHHVRLR